MILRELETFRILMLDIAKEKGGIENASLLACISVIKAEFEKAGYHVNFIEASMEVFDNVVRWKPEPDDVWCLDDGRIYREYISLEADESYMTLDMDGATSTVSDSDYGKLKRTLKRDIPAT